MPYEIKKINDNHKFLTQRSLACVGLTLGKLKLPKEEIIVILFIQLIGCTQLLEIRG